MAIRPFLGLDGALLRLFTDGKRIPGAAGMTNINRIRARIPRPYNLEPRPKHLVEMMKIQKGWNLPVMVAVVGLMLFPLY